MDAGGICSTPFWNQSSSWETKDPYFSDCFKHLVLVIGSCAVLWIVAPLEFIKICRYHGTPRPWTRLSIAKIILKILLLIICVIELIKEIYAYITHSKPGLDGLIAAISYFITIILTVIITMMCKKRGLPSSLALPSFWMISTIATIISIYDDIHSLDWNDWVSSISLLDDSVTFVISLIQLILSSMADNVVSRTGRQSLDYCPLEGCSLPSRLTHSWLLGLFAKGIHNSLHQDFLIPQCSELRSTNVAKEFDQIWKDDVSDNDHLPTENSERLLDNEEVDVEERMENAPNYDRKRSLLNVLMKITMKYLMISSILEIVYSALYFLPTYILSLVLNCSKEQEWHKYLYASTLFLALLLCTFTDSQRKYYGLLAAIRIKTAIMNAVFEKALVSQELQDVKTYLHDDAEYIFQMVCLATEVWGAPIRLIIGLYLLWMFLGSASFVGIAVAAFLIPLNILVSHTANYFQEKTLTSKNERNNVFSETLQGMKVIKFYAWEEFFLEKLISLRKSEIKGVRKAVYLKMSFKFLILSSTSLVALATFAVYVLMGNSTEMSTIFIALYLMCLLKTPFTSLLRLLAYFVQGLVSVSKIQKFLEAKEAQNLQRLDDDPGYSIMLDRASFAWDSSTSACLKNLNLNVRPSSLVAVVGYPQSGKTSLLRSLLGQMEKLTGTANVKGEVAFIADIPWIQNTTVEKNILFLKPKVDFIYRKTLEACDLLADIDVLPEGDETEIGEKGYHLTEDQKLKVDLARGVYQNADMYLLDNPFRCTETSVAEHLYQRVIGRSGILKAKTRIFTTTDAMFLPLVDKIIFLKDGWIVEQGSYEELLEKNGYLSEYLKSLSNISSSTKSNRKHLPVSKTNISVTENFKHHCDPWYSASGVSLKSEVENVMHCELMDAPKGLFQKLYKYMKMNSYVLTFMTILVAGIAGCCEVGSYIWWTQWTPEHAKGHKLYIHLYIYAGFILGQVLSTALCGILLFTGSTLAVEKLYAWLLNKIMRAPQNTFVSTFVDKMTNSFNKDFPYTDEKIPMLFYVWLITVLKAPVLLLVIFIKSPILCVFSIPLAIAVFVIMKLYLSTWRQLHHLSAATRCPLSNLLKETLHGITNIRAYNASYHFINRFQVKLDTHNNCYFLFLLVSRWLSSSMEIIGSFFVFLTALTVLVQKDHESNFVGLIIIFSMQIAENLISTTYMSSLLDVDLIALERLQSFSTIKQEAEWENPSCELPSQWPTNGLIFIKNLCTTYGETLYPVLNNINMTVHPGEKVAIVGKEDSGIYTILDSLFRIREISEGQIFIDNIDISYTGLHELRSRLAFVPQNPVIFSGTVRENLDPNKKYLDEELKTAMKTAKLSALFTDLNKIIGEPISLGDKHRISLARCLLKKPKIVVLDEPENCFEDGKNMFQNCTLLTFSESDVLDNYNRVIHISSGEVTEEPVSDPVASYYH